MALIVTTLKSFIFFFFFKVPHCQLKVKVKLANTSDMLMALEPKPMLCSAGGDIWQLQHWTLSSNKVTFVALRLTCTLSLHGLLKCKMRCVLGSGSTILSVLKCHTAFSLHPARIYIELEAVCYSFLCMQCVSQGLVLRVELQK